MDCPSCNSHDLRKAGLKTGAQRYRCRTCGRYCTDRPRKFSAETKAHAVDMYLNNVGIRKMITDASGKLWYMGSHNGRLGVVE